MRTMNLAGMIDHTLLKPEATEKDIVNLCHEAKQHKFATVCINPAYICTAAKLLHGSGVGVATVIGFPLGATMTEIKVQEIFAAKAHGAREVDIVINIGWAKSGNWEAVAKDITRAVEAAHCCGVTIKVIIETSLLTEEEKQKAAEIVKASGADYIKTSTGFAGGGATVEDVRNLKAWVGQSVKVKASGGIRSRETALQMVEAGADRLGTSSGVQIITV
ncbi:deoxyribose-phosphate aldolase [Desulfitobacterium sp. LBE]|uniref:Deoxyribose-phosphate aldolase n=3 Tax=root TaxID=1 RepID=DEOC_DESHD|nr:MULTISPECIES: deoxyribose-phosphate aldolase [Desulfitobacterium]B8FUK9.1 RecName: Full=Deoxyribose-phosphate aldolase; Short=DERA; AltName: Full=2-deoxy-D-ribose 5-phosphate aldolase; AltName: Full=Phosphodeoxyriboaldolase; Short=Deoxyriboaldolase [Desulfitobacterium hafniense DCB-2]ACL22279.1 deoxyribose-phosphate aldolase [Desulfitobacterium hafniense DCB-2]MEA5021382.1 deoxyribose-phosphate aldolase [Desulfitobacterium hafniense]TWH59946.1 deoxyribose-phosphate aldolase [Desulfitobacteri